MDGFTIPIGADFSVMQNAVDQIVAAMDRMANKITAAMNQTAASAETSAAKLKQNAETAANLATAATGAVAGLRFLNTATRALTGINLVQRLRGWITSLGGIRGALAAIPRMMRAIASNRTFQILAVSAVAAVTAIYTVRLACRVVAGSVRLLRSTATTAFRAIGNAARAAGNAISGAFAGIAALTPGGPLIAGLLSVASVIGVVFKSISKAADMETLETAFAPLLGSAKAAQERIEELAKFAKDTPFELPEVAQASRTLQTLTKGALATGEGLRMVGDVAAATQQPIGELSVWIGRLYDGLQTGRPVGEAMSRLQELGVVSGEVRGKIENLQQSGAKGPAVWNEAAAALGVFSGSMERQSKTWKGKLSNLSDSVGQLMAKFGEPIIDALKPFLDGAISRVESLQGVAIRAGNAIRTALSGTMAAFETGTVLELLGNGLELAFITGINRFMDGLRAGMNFLSAALSGILRAVGDGLAQSGLLPVFENLADALGFKISAAIMRAIANIPGLGALDAVGQVHENVAGIKMDEAKRGLGKLDLAGAMKSFTDGLKKTFEEAREALTLGKGDPLINDAATRAKLNDNLLTIQRRMHANAEKTAAELAALDAKLQKPPAPGSGEDGGPMGAVSRAVAPAVMSLTRIGGGGFSNTVLNGQLTEARKQTSLLTRVVRAVELNQGAKRITASYA
ncbi:MAG: hypothetical protein V4819_19165 [Verrucomicrobiota bacterium]